MALAIGPRLGELLALTWDDVDLDKGIVEINKSLYWEKGKGLQIGPPKTKGSVRTNRVGPRTVNALREHRRLQAELAQKHAQHWSDRGFVFTTFRGGPYWPSNVSRAFKQALEQAGIPQDVRCHDMRGTCATFMGSLNVPEGTRMKIMGWTPSKHHAQRVHAGVG